jgi:hypothetical protein
MRKTWGPRRRGKTVQMVRSVFRYAVEEREIRIRFGRLLCRIGFGHGWVLLLPVVFWPGR